MYLLTKSIHQFCALASFSLFVARGVWMLRDSPVLARRWVKVLPHVIDSVLLASAVTLTLLLQQYPLTHAWLSAKLVALPVYIGLGLVALRPGRTRSVRAAAWLAALAVFGYIVSVAIERDPLGFLAFLRPN